MPWRPWWKPGSMNGTDAGQPPPSQAPPSQSRCGGLLPERHLFGIAACAGVAIGPVFRTTEPPAQVTRHKIHAADVQAEGARLDAAILQSRKQLMKLRSRLVVLPEESQGEIAPLLDAYIQMLGPSRLVRGARTRIGDRLVSAETAVMEEAPAIAAALAAASEAVEVHFAWRPQLADPDDEMVLDAAVNGQADALVTHNLADFAQAAPRFGLALLRPGELLERMKR